VVELPVLKEVEVYEEDLVDVRDIPVLLATPQAPRLELAGIVERPQLLIVIRLGQLQLDIGLLPVVKLTDGQQDCRGIR
jgi:hypothetical protein